MYSLESPSLGDSNEYTQHIAHDKIEKKIPKLSINICFLGLLREFPRNSKNEFELAIVNEPSVFESVRFYCTLVIVHMPFAWSLFVPHLFFFQYLGVCGSSCVTLLLIFFKEHTSKQMCHLDSKSRNWIMFKAINHTNVQFFRKAIFMLPMKSSIIQKR